MSTHLPIRSLRPICRHNAYQRIVSRPFSSSVARPRQTRSVDPVVAKAQMKYQTSMAPNTSQAQIMQEQNIQMDDYGLLSGTFIRGNPPSLFASPINEALKARGAYEWKYLRTRLQDFMTQMYFFWRLTNWPWKERPRFNARETREALRTNYIKMYEAFANNDTKTLKEVCNTGLQDHFESRIHARPEGTKVTWELLSAGRRPQIMSNRPTKLPVPGENENDRVTPSGIRQVVFRMKTRQRLTIKRIDQPTARPALDTKVKAPKWSPDGTGFRKAKRAAPTVDVHEKEVVEYVVMQQLMNRGKMEDWKIWGFAEPTTLESIEKDAKFEEETAAWNAIDQARYR